MIYVHPYSDNAQDNTEFILDWIKKNSKLRQGKEGLSSHKIKKIGKVFSNKIDPKLTEPTYNVLEGMHNYTINPIETDNIEHNEASEERYDKKMENIFDKIKEAIDNISIDDLSYKLEKKSDEKYNFFDKIEYYNMKDYLRDSSPYKKDFNFMEKFDEYNKIAMDSMKKYKKGQKFLSDPNFQRMIMN